MKTSLIAAACGAVLVLAGCGDGKDAAPATPPGAAPAGGGAAGVLDAAKKTAGEAVDAGKKAVDAGVDAAKKTAEDAAKATADAAADAKAKAIAGLKATLDGLKPKLDELAKKGESLDPLRKTAFTPVMDGLNKQFGESMKTLGSMGSSNDWQAIGTKLSPMLDSLKSGLDAALKQFGG